MTSETKDTKKKETTKRTPRQVTESQSRQRVRRDDLYYSGPEAVELAKYGVDPKEYRTRWVHDYLGRLDRIQKLGYDFVLDGKGEPITRAVQKEGEIVNKYLMKTPVELYLQGQAFKEKRIREQLTKLESPDATSGQYVTSDTNINK